MPIVKETSTVGRGLDMSYLITDPAFAQALQLIRVTNSIVDDGSAADGTVVPTEETFDTSGVVQPAKFDQLQFLPEGERNYETIAVYTTTQLSIGDQQNSGADVIVYRGGYYRVSFVKARPENGFWMALAVRVKRDA